MAIAKRGSRKITVDGRTYRWLVRHKPTYSQGLAQAPMSFAVEAADAHGSVLVVQTTAPRPDNWMGHLAPTAPPVLPHDVAASIRQARRQGWQPDTPGPQFILNLAG